jgi:uncharacterized DUF497 family protein
MRYTLRCYRDIAKAIRNYEKHGIAFEEAATVVGDSSGLDGADVEHSIHEADSNE